MLMLDHWTAGSVTALSVAPDCSMLATASADKTVFLFKVVSAHTYDPLGFFKLDQEPTCMDWHPSSSKIIIGCRFAFNSMTTKVTGPATACAQRPCHCLLAAQSRVLAMRPACSVCQCPKNVARTHMHVNAMHRVWQDDLCHCCCVWAVLAGIVLCMTALMQICMLLHNLTSVALLLLLMPGV